MKRLIGAFGILMFLWAFNAYRDSFAWDYLGELGQKDRDLAVMFMGLSIALIGYGFF